MSQRPEPDIDQVRRALRERDERAGNDTDEPDTGPEDESEDDED
jgi:hypothetical protein